MNQLPNLLIVDDIEVNLFLLEDVIKSLKVNVIKALSGTEALEKTRGIELALAIIDVRMPEMDGYELAVKINEERPFEKVPVIFVTASHVNEMDVFKGYNSGAVDYILRPVDYHILLCKISVFLDLFNQKQTFARVSRLLKKSANELAGRNNALKKGEEKYLIDSDNEPNGGVPDEKTEDKLRNALEQLKKLTQYTESAIENERKSISRELHDDLGQALTAVKIDLEIIRQNVSNREVLLRINKTTALVGETIKTVQRLTSRLRPAILDDLGLEAAIEYYTNEFKQRNGIEVTFEWIPGITVSPDASLTLFRIMQESLTNIARHAKATRVNIGMNKTGESMIFSISDNGIGITDLEMNSSQSFGIMGMKERSASLGGTFNMYRENGHGTIINVTFPI